MYLSRDVDAVADVAALGEAAAGCAATLLVPLRPGADLDTAGPAAPWLPGAVPAAARLELVLVDPGVPACRQLVEDLMAATEDGRRFEVVILDGETDGIDQITRILGDRRGLDAVHLVSHGAAGGLWFGDTWLDSARLAADADAVRAWGAALDEEADLLLYACGLAGGEAGRGLVQALADLTGADVAASTDLTGDLGRGGDWDLEYRCGRIETAIAFDLDLQSNWAGLLAAPTTADGTVATDEDVAYTFGLADFSYSDGDGDPLVQIQVTGLGLDGSLKFEGVAVTRGQVIAAADIDAGLLEFVPAPDANGAACGQFQFRVHDGTDYSAETATLAILSAAFD
ncbi:MAG: DUF4347 domain-containing protein, partial [Planctomycetes bacterium]|nr:DUF4347 domain-containing protein [Planctomycetota bacterium]